jgi:ABC-type Na+ efflux pump permease subunit
MAGRSARGLGVLGVIALALADLFLSVVALILLLVLIEVSSNPNEYRDGASKTAALLLVACLAFLTAGILLLVRLVRRIRGARSDQSLSP